MGTWILRSRLGRPYSEEGFQVLFCSITSDLTTAIATRCNSISRGRERPCGCYISLGLMRTQLTCMSCFSYKPVYNLEKEEISCAFISESWLKHVLTCGLEHFPIFARIVWFCCRYFNTSMGQSRSDCIGFTLPQAVVLFPFVQVDFTQEMSNSSLSLESIKSIHL